MKQVVRRGYGVSILGDMQNPIGHDPERPGPAALVLSRDFGLDHLQSSHLSYSVILFSQSAWQLQGKAHGHG